MRFLHTSDWHLGRGFHGFSLRTEQEQLCEAVCADVREQNIDAVLIAGDVYDRALPPEWAVELLERTLGRLVELGAKVIVTSGNHDSAARLGFGRSLMRSSGCTSAAHSKTPGCPWSWRTSTARCWSTASPTWSRSFTPRSSAVSAPTTLP
ncbi:exonuclease subunit SbcD [Nesterenkonia pannonica]|uniref:metallophosphoesterase family protein n=1 Tax=Nesterenkonia pannonica TaxID=1548602 RepID=UPI00216403AC|nr:exonuclease subunit SbcD [Nesterenkonia pannonica]